MAAALGRNAVACWEFADETESCDDGVSTRASSATQRLREKELTAEG
jgi:hypothetical protein